MNPEPIRCLIIDDDPFILDLLCDKLNAHFPEVRVLDRAKSGKEALQHIQMYKPDLLFLDVEMSDMTGFELLAQIETIHFETIFVTSFSHYAIKAIRFNALDYLVKPIDLGELKKAITRYKKRRKAKANSGKRNVELALYNLSTPQPKDQILYLKTQNGELKLILKDIIQVEGDRNYSQIYLANRRKHLVSKTLLEMEELLGDKGFFRCHKSHIVNVSHIQSLLNRSNILLSNEAKIPISRRKKPEFLEWYSRSENEFKD